MDELVTHHRHGRRCFERIQKIENELADVRREFEEAGRDYIRDVDAHQREKSRLKRLLTEHGIDWNPPEASTVTDPRSMSYDELERRYILLLETAGWTDPDKNKTWVRKQAHAKLDEALDMYDRRRPSDRPRS